MRASTLAMLMTILEVCEVSIRQEQSVKVNAFLYVVTLCLRSGLATHGTALML